MFYLTMIDEYMSAAAAAAATTEHQASDTTISRSKSVAMGMSVGTRR